MLIRTIVAVLSTGSAFHLLPIKKRPLPTLHTPPPILHLKPTPTPITTLPISTLYAIFPTPQTFPILQKGAFFAFLAGVGGGAFLAVWGAVLAGGGVLGVEGGGGAGGQGGAGGEGGEGVGGSALLACFCIVACVAVSHAILTFFKERGHVLPGRTLARIRFTVEGAPFKTPITRRPIPTCPTIPRTGLFFHSRAADPLTIEVQRRLANRARPGT